MMQQIDRHTLACMSKDSSEHQNQQYTSKDSTTLPLSLSSTKGDEYFVNFEVTLSGAKITRASSKKCTGQLATPVQFLASSRDAGRE